MPYSTGKKAPKAFKTCSKCKTKTACRAAKKCLGKK